MLKDQDRWEIRALHRNGNSIRHIRDITHRDRKTIRNVLTALSPTRSNISFPKGALRPVNQGIN